MFIWISIMMNELSFSFYSAFQCSTFTSRNHVADCFVLCMFCVASSGARSTLFAFERVVRNGENCIMLQTCHQVSFVCAHILLTILKNLYFARRSAWILTRAMLPYSSWHFVRLLARFFSSMSLFFARFSPISLRFAF